jgi:small conductance mechanosensitive channel
MKTEIFFSLLKKTSRFIIIALLSFTLTLSFAPTSSGQFPLSISSSSEGIPQLPRWDPNKARQCGKFWCSDVFFYGSKRLFVLNSFQSTLATFIVDSKELREIQEGLTLGAFIRNPENPEQPPQETAFNLEQRAKLIQDGFKNIFLKILNTRPKFPISNQKDWHFWLLTTQKPLHPLTPKIEVGFEKGQTVVFVPQQEELGLGAQTIVTVIESDSKVNAQSIAELAETWRVLMRRSISNVLWGHEFDLRYPWLRIIFVGAIALILLILIQITRFVRQFLRNWKKNVNQQIAELKDSFVKNPETLTKEDIIKSPWQNIPIKFWLLLLEKDYLAAILLLDEFPEKINYSNLTDGSKGARPLKVLSKLASWLEFLFLRAITRGKSITEKNDKLTLKTQLFLTQEENFIDLLLIISWVWMFSITLISFAAIASIFPSSRLLIPILINQVFLVPLIWIVMLLADKIVDFFIDYALVRWAKEGQEKDPNSNRYNLRAQTYSKALTDGTTILFILLGIILTVVVIGINPTVLAGAGALTAIFAYLSRNVLEDMINGVLILATDRYAVGDVIDLGGALSGFVEEMSLYSTSLRNLDGQMIVIPNGKIDSVINNTKNWSRVNFLVKISWNSDVKKAIEVMRQVGEQMFSEPQWAELVLEPVDILGVDELSHDGILIRLLIKTLPMQQWLIGREFRLRVKEALDEAGISLGVPQREVAVINSPTESRENSEVNGK